MTGHRACSVPRPALLTDGAPSSPALTLGQGSIYSPCQRSKTQCEAQVPAPQLGICRAPGRDCPGRVSSLAPCAPAQPGAGSHCSLTVLAVPGSPALLQQMPRAAWHCPAGPAEPQGCSGCISAAWGSGQPLSLIWAGTGELLLPDTLCPTAPAGLGPCLGSWEPCLGSSGRDPWAPAMGELLGCCQSILGWGGHGLHHQLWWLWRPALCLGGIFVLLLLGLGDSGAF